VFGKRNGQHGHYGHYRRIISKLMKSIDSIEEMFLRDNQVYLTKKGRKKLNFLPVKTVSCPRVQTKAVILYITGNVFFCKGDIRMVNIKLETEEVILTEAQAAEILGVSQSTIYRYRMRGLLSYLKPVKKVYVTYQALLKFIVYRLIVESDGKST